jgi:hypothetical protein
VRVIDPEHLVALAFQAGGHRRRERAWQMLDVGVVDRQRLRTLLLAHGIMMDIDLPRSHTTAVPTGLIENKAAWHRVQASLPIREKVRILLELQRQVLPLLAKQRPLRAWERPWPVEP